MSSPPTVDIPCGHVLGIRSRLVSVRDEGWHLDIVMDIEDADPSLAERVASWNGQGWVADTRSRFTRHAYRALRESDAIAYRGLRSVMDRPVWEVRDAR